MPYLPLLLLLTSRKQANVQINNLERHIPNSQRTSSRSVSARISETMATQYEALQSPVIHGNDARNLLTISPYTEREHMLDLVTLDTENMILAQALVHLKCLRPDYATAPYVDTFNWGEVVEQVKLLAQQEQHIWKTNSFFVVAFRSRIPPTTVYEDLGVLDKASHAEATASGGLLKYWFGSPDREGRNLATCVWRSLEDAKKGGIGPAHRRAASAARGLYSDWKIDRHRLTIHDKADSWEITDWA